MSWLYYLLEANLYLLIFYGFYRLFLHHETFYNSNRYYLLGTSLVAFLLPILQLGFLKPAAILSPSVLDSQMAYGEEMVITTTVPLVEHVAYTAYLYPVYLLIAACFAIKLTIDVAKIIKIWLRANKKRSGHITVIELNDQAAFSFFNLLFIHPHLAEKKAVIHHEMVHIKQKHSVDILFFEILHILCWFNPIIFLIKKDIKLLHEYIADELSSDAGMQKHEYAMFLIENSFGIMPTALTNQIFNQSILKSRINMLNKKRTAGWARLKLLLALPLVGGMLCASTMAFTKDYGYVDLLPEKSEAAMNLFQNTPQKAEAQKQSTTKTERVAVKAPPQVKTARTEKIKFPPPIETQDQFFPVRTNTKTQKPMVFEKRYILINGEPLKDLMSFKGVSNAEKINYLTAEAATKKYGAKGKYGAVEIYGKNLKLSNIAPPPPVQAPPTRLKGTIPVAKREMDTTRRIYLRERSRPLTIKRDASDTTRVPKMRPPVRAIRGTVPLRLKRSPDSIRTIRVQPTKVGDLKTLRLKEVGTVREIQIKPSTAVKVSDKTATEVSIGTTKPKVKLQEVQIVKPTKKSENKEKVVELEIVPTKN